MYRAESAGVVTVGLGDSPNDLPMLKVVDLPVVIPRAPGTIDPALSGLPWRRASAPGPAEWNEAVLETLHEMEGRTENRWIKS